ncbi:MAG: hypothetical protein NTW86_24175 [Candidatus Sumerlaeota bacterium]|nr:hypothetical protein [Candidatus Sumerlaeota bacterium]
MAVSLRPDLTSNLWLGFASVFIAFVIWLIAKEGQFEDRGVAVRIRHPQVDNADIQVSPQEATVYLRLPVSQASQVSRSNCWVELPPELIGPFSEWSNGELKKTVRLNPSMVVLNDLPHTIQVLSVDPASVKLEGHLYTREALVKAQLVGEPAQGYRLAGEPRVEPERVQLTASPTRLDELSKSAEGGSIVVSTQPISLDNHDEYFAVRVPLVLPPDVDMAPGYEPRVDVVTPIEEVTGKRSIESVPIRVQTFSRAVQAIIEPTRATVTVEGPVSLIRGLKPEDFSVTPKEAPNEEPGAEANLALDFQFHESVGRRERESVRILGGEPKSVHVVMAPVGGEHAPIQEAPAAAPTPAAPPALTPAPAKPPARTPMPRPRLTPMALDHETSGAALTLKRLESIPVYENLVGPPAPKP